MTHADVPVLYRFSERQTAGGLDEWGDPIPGDRGTLYINLTQHPVLRRTPKGWRLKCGAFVLASARKKFACPTVAEALESFVARKERQARIHMARAVTAMESLNAAKRLSEKLTDKLSTAVANNPSNWGATSLPSELCDGVKLEIFPNTRILKAPT